ncbi:MAG: hypothetical protein P1V20_32070, partial [Verrucomicrobiales bacterium]|nr:hypothetical protein [Verrucomicrobiales bacterium]
RTPGGVGGAGSNPVPTRFWPLSSAVRPTRRSTIRAKILDEYSLDLFQGESGMGFGKVYRISDYCLLF